LANLTAEKEQDKKDWEKSKFLSLVYRIIADSFVEKEEEERKHREYQEKKSEFPCSESLNSTANHCFRARGRGAKSAPLSEHPTTIILI